MTTPHPRTVAVRRRVLRIRRAVAATAVTVFLALFATIYVQMASGNDPGLVTAPTSATDSPTSTDSTDSTDSSDSTDSTDSGEPAAVTTTQS